MADAIITYSFKKCTCCKVDKPATPEHFKRSTPRPDGLWPYCKPCDKVRRKAEYAAWRAKNPLPAKDVLPDGMKRCSMCRGVKSKENFTKHTNTPDGLNCACKECRSERRTALRLQSLDAALERERTARARNRESRNEAARRRHASNKAVANAASREWYRNNIDRKREAIRQWRADNPGALRAQLRRAYRKNPLRYAISGMVAHHLRRNGGSKSRQKFETLLGYSVADLRRHLERQFVKGMDWSNYGSAWEVDHITPLSRLPAATPEDPNFRAAWALTNLRPLWARENRSKGGKLLLLL